MNAVAIGSISWKMWVTYFCRIMPIAAAGIVPIIISGTNFPYSDLKSKCAIAESIFMMSFLKNKRTTSSVPMCNVNSKSSVFSGVKNCM